MKITKEGTQIIVADNSEIARGILAGDSLYIDDNGTISLRDYDPTKEPETKWQLLKRLKTANSIEDLKEIIRMLANLMPSNV